MEILGAGLAVLGAWLFAARLFMDRAGWAIETHRTLAWVVLVGAVLGTCGLLDALP